MNKNKLTEVIQWGDRDKDVPELGFRILVLYIVEKA